MTTASSGFVHSGQEHENMSIAVSFVKPFQSLGYNILFPRLKSRPFHVVVEMLTFLIPRFRTLSNAIERFPNAFRTLSNAFRTLSNVSERFRTLPNAYTKARITTNPVARASK